MTSTLSPKQQKVFDLVEQELTPLAIASKLGTTEAAVKAQITRIQKKLRKDITSGERKRARAAVKPKTVPPTTPAEVVQQAAEAGPAVYDVPEQVQQAAEKAAAGLDIHPMILLGVTIQFVKLVGGRLAAHQVIEDVWNAMRVMLMDGEPPTSMESPLGDAQVELQRKAAELEQAMAGFRESLKPFSDR